MKFRPSLRKSARQRYADNHPVKVFEGATLTPAQRKIADRVTTGGERFFVVCAGRQTGKSFLAVQILLWFAINRPNTTSMYVSMTYPQVTKIWQEIYRGIKDSGIIASYSKSNFQIDFKNGSTIYFRSYQNADNSRGYTVNAVMIIDEAAWLPDGEFEKIFRPQMITSKTAKCLLVSSPRGENWFAEYWRRGTKEGRTLNKNTISFKMTYRDNPFADVSEIEAMKQTMPDLIYRQEIEAEFISGAASAFGEKYKDCISYDIQTQRNPNDRYFMGVDVGRQNDYTVATVVSAISGEVVEILRLRQLPFEQIAAEIVRIAQKWRPSTILQETNGIGDPFFELLGKKLNEKYIGGLTAWTTTNQSKNNIIEALNIAFDEKSIKIPPDDELLNEIEAFEVKYSMKSHAVTYGARNGFHDDTIISLALSQWARRTHAVSGQYAII